MAGIEPGVVVETSEDPLGDIGIQRLEALPSHCCVPEPAGKEGVPGEQVRAAARVGIGQRHGTRRVPPQGEHVQGDAVDLDPVPLPETDIGCERQRIGVLGAGIRGRAKLLGHLDQGPGVIPVLMGRDQRVEATGALGDEFTDPMGVVGGVNEDLGAAGGGRQQVHVVVHRGDGHLADRHPGQAAHRRWSAGDDHRVIGGLVGAGQVKRSVHLDLLPKLDRCVRVWPVSPGSGLGQDPCGRSGSGSAVSSVAEPLANHSSSAAGLPDTTGPPTPTTRSG